MQSGDRQQVRQAGIAERLLDLFGDRAAFAGDQRRGDPSCRRRAAPRRSAVSSRCAAAATPRASRLPFRAGHSARGAKAVADPADAGEKQLALKIPSTRHHLDRHRIEHGLEA